VSRFRFDWRWVALVGFVVLLANAGRLPWQVVVLLLGSAGAYVLTLGWRTWTHTGGSPTRSRVTYWRGPRSEVAPPRRGPPLPRLSDIGPALLYLLLGGALVLAAVTMVLNALGA
jgi:hypothetical protein